ncbi:TonB-dependent receptor [Niabella defluvii]|nr:TonB-dependent receptor [Niabella sp. I65]
MIGKTRYGWWRLKDIKDLIIFYTDPETFAGRYMNRDEQNDYGFEIESNIGIGNIGQWVSNFTYINGRGINAGIPSKNLFRRPDFIVNSTLTVNPFKSLTVAPSFRYVGERIPGEYDLGGPNPMSAYYTIDFYAAYTIKKKISLLQT